MLFTSDRVLVLPLHMIGNLQYYEVLHVLNYDGGSTPRGTVSRNSPAFEGLNASTLFSIQPLTFHSWLSYCVVQGPHVTDYDMVAVLNISDTPAFVSRKSTM